MRLDISEIVREIGKSVDYEIEEPRLVDENVECTKPILGKMLFSNTGGSLLVKGVAQTAVALPCSRCGDYFEEPVDLAFDEQFTLVHQATGHRSLQTVTIIEEDASPVAGKLIDGHVFDLTELLRQSILLAEPSRPVPPCDAAGRCEHCHRDPEEVLRAAGINDAAAQTNPALAELARLLKPEDEV